MAAARAAASAADWADAASYGRPRVVATTVAEQAGRLAARRLGLHRRFLGEVSGAATGRDYAAAMCGHRNGFGDWLPPGNATLVHKSLILRTRLLPGLLQMLLRPERWGKLT
eukprot:scaffold85453_cov54-Phaeocystis_antarctica.AAC.1